MLTEYKIIHLGDLYRFYVDESGEVALVMFYFLMGTHEQELEIDEVPPEVISLFENLYLS